MGTFRKIARRTFLVASVAIAGGVVFGIRTYNAHLENPLTARLGMGGAALTPYIKISADGITIITPRAEMGQGIHTTLAAIDPQRTPELRPKTKWRILGKFQDRLDVVDQSTGAAVYASDIRLPGMRFGAVRRNPNVRCNLTSFDAKEAVAMPGVDVVEYEWENPGLPPDTDSHFDVFALALIPEILDSVQRDDGDVDTALDGADIIEAEYRVPYLAHATLAPMSAATWLDGDTQRIWTGAQGPTVARRGEMDFVQIAAKVAVALPNLPVLVTYPREEDMSRGPYRPASMGRFRAAVADGKLTAVAIDSTSPSILKGITERGGSPAPIPDFAPDCTISQALWDQPYSIENYRARAYRSSDVLPASFWRSVGASQNAYCHECMMDEIAIAAERDPVEMRLEVITDDPSRRVLEAVAKMSNWGTARGPERRLDAAIGEKISVTDGMVDQSNYHDDPPMRMYQSPIIHTRILENAPHIRGIGEVGTPAAAPALVNAVFVSTGQRIRTLPLGDSIPFI
jgi:isoquinoline 1-oxidoreductase beta subunit